MSSILSKTDKSKLRILRSFLRITPHVFTFMVCRFLNGEIDNMKNKSNKILFWSLFIPYVLLVANSLKSAVNGISVFSELHYGIEAYFDCFIFTFFIFWYIFVACLICQIIILLIEKFKNKTKIKLYVLGMFIIYVLGDVLLFVEGF